MIDPQRVVLMRAEQLHDVATQQGRVDELEALLDDERRHLDALERYRDAFEAGVRRARAVGLLVDHPCRHCSSGGLSDTGHVYGQRKCCPDCDHRPTVGERCAWCGRTEQPGEAHGQILGATDEGEPNDFGCLGDDGRLLQHHPQPDVAGGPPPF